MKRKTVRVLSFLVVLVLLLFGFVGYNFYSTTRVLETAGLLGEFVTDTIPFSYAPSGHILIQAKINGSDNSYPFILDSGASNMIFDSHRSEFNLESEGLSLSFGSNGSYFSAEVHRLERVQIGNLKFKDIGLKVTDLNFSCMDSIYGIVGTGIMRHLIWQIDFEKEIIIVSNQLDDLQFSDDKIELALNENKISHHLKVPITLSKKNKSIEALLDLGSNTTLTLKESEISESYVQPKFKAIQGKSSEGLGNPSNSSTASKYYLLDNLMVGRSGFHLNQVPVYASSRNINLLGLGILDNYKTTISWKDRKLILEPYSGTPSFTWKTAGFAMNFTDKAVIVAIMEKSPADELNMKVGSEVLSINGVSLKGDNFCSFQNSKDYQSSDTLNLRIKNRGKISNYQLIKEPIFK